MVETASLRLAVVGRNVSAALLIQELMSFADIEVTWLQTDKDLRPHPWPEWVLCPPSFAAGLLEVKSESGPAPGITRLEDFYIFSEGRRRISAADFSAHRLWDRWKNIHPSVRRRCLSVGIWNDLSPPIWTEKKRGLRRVPNAAWPRQIPMSLEASAMEPAILAPYLVDRERLLKGVAAEAKRRGVRILHGNQTVLGLQPGSGRGGHRLLHNAPFGHTEVDRVIWATSVAKIKEEAATPKRVLKDPLREAVGCWENHGAWVDAGCVSALPPFSLWLEPSRGDLFLETGILSSKNLRRVFALPPAFTGRENSDYWLQIQELSIEESAFGEIPEAIAEEPRRDGFLWPLCPYLEAQSPAFAALPSSDENLFFHEPTAHWHSFGQGIFYWFAGSLEKFPAAAKHVLTQFRNARS